MQMDKGTFPMTLHPVYFYLLLFMGFIVVLF